MARWRWLGVGGALIILALAAVFWSPRVDDPPGTAEPEPAPRSEPARAVGSTALAEITGFVSAKAGGALAKALVCVHCAGETCGRDVCGESGDDGAYRLRGLVAGEYAVTCAAEGYSSARRSAVLRSSRESLGLDFVLEVGGAWVRGRVRTPDGAGVPGALVESLSGFDAGQAEARAESDRDGRFALWLGHAAGLVRATAAGFAPEQVMARAGAEELDIVLERAGTLRGLVIDAASGAPLAGVQVDAGSILGGGWEIAPERTAADGWFAFRSLPPGRYKPLVSGDGWFGIAARAVVVTAQAAPEAVTIAARRGARVTGSVRARDDGTPCASGSVLATGALDSMELAPVEAGLFAFAGLQAGRYELKVTCSNLVGSSAVEPLVVGEADISGLELLLERGHSVSGRVVRSSGAGAAAITVRLASATQWSTVTTDEAGAFHSEPLAPGRYSLSAARRFATLSEGAVEVDLTDGPVSDVLLTIADASALRVRVVDAGAQPVRDMRLALELAGRRTPVGRSDATGMAYREGLEPGDFLLIAEHGGRRYAEHPVRLVADEMTEVELRLDEPGQTLRGVVLDTEGRPVPSALVLLHGDRAHGPSPHAGASFGSSSTSSDAAGAFAFEGLVATTYRLSARSAEGAFGEASGAPGTLVEITLQAAGEIEGSVRSAADAPVMRFSIVASERQQHLVREETFSNEAGAWSLAGLPPGSWEVVAEADGGAARATVPLESAERVSGVELRLGAGSMVTGRLVDFDDGAPLSGIGMTLSATGASGHGRALRSGADGRFRLEDAPGGPLVLRIREAPGYVGPIDLHASLEEGRPHDFGDIRLRKRPDAERGMFGFRVQWPPADPAEGLVIDWLKPGGPAEEAGLSLGDRIVAVRGTSVRGESAYLFWQLIYATRGEALELALADGREVTMRAGAWSP